MLLVNKMEEEKHADVRTIICVQPEIQYVLFLETHPPKKLKIYVGGYFSWYRKPNHREKRSKALV